MTYKQKLTKIGNSMGIVIPKEIRDLLKLDSGVELYLEPQVEDNSIVINAKKTSTTIDPQFYELLNEVDKQYSAALEELVSK